MKLHRQLIFSNILVTLVFSVCVEQQLTPQCYEISVNVPSGKISIQYYTICNDENDKLRKVGEVKCSKNNGCTSTNSTPTPFTQKPVIDILNKMLMDNKNTSFFKYICRQEDKADDGVIFKFSELVLINDGFFFNPTTRFLAAWDTSDLKKLPQKREILYRGNVTRFRLDNSSEYISFRSRIMNRYYTIRLNEEGSTNNKIISQICTRNASIIQEVNSIYLKFIKPMDISFTHCKNRFCRGIGDFINFGPKPEESQLIFYISLSFNGFTVIVIICLSVFKLFRACNKEVPYSNKKLDDNTAEKDRPASYVTFVNKNPNGKCQSNNYSVQDDQEMRPNNSKNMNPKETHSEFHEYFTIGSDVSKQYEVLRNNSSLTKEAENRKAESQSHSKDRPNDDLHIYQNLR